MSIKNVAANRISVDEYNQIIDEEAIFEELAARLAEEKGTRGNTDWSNCVPRLPLYYKLDSMQESRI